MKSVFETLRRWSDRLPVLILCVFAGALLGACSTPYRAETTVFHQWPNHTASAMVFKFAVPAPGEQTLERSAHEGVLRQMLLAKGFRESPEVTSGSPSSPPVILSFSYSSRESRRLIEGDRWGSPGIWAGGVFRHGGIMLGGSFPIGGNTAREIAVQERQLTLLITEEKAGQSTRLYEGKALAVDSGRDALAALPYLVRALLEDFPGPSGVTRQVQIPVAR